MSQKTNETLGIDVLQHKCTTIATYATSSSNFATSIRNPYNIPLKQIKHLKIYACNMRFQRNVTLLLGRIELNLVQLDVGTELDATECAEVVGAELVGGTGVCVVLCSSKKRSRCFLERTNDGCLEIRR
jgi:hypothetical protein